MQSLHNLWRCITNNLKERLLMIKDFIKKVKAKDSYVRGYADARSMMMETMDEAVAEIESKLRCQFCGNEHADASIEYMGESALICGYCYEEQCENIKEEVHND